MRSFEIGVVLPLNQSGPDRVTPRWSVVREMALRAEAIGFDTVWTPDELLGGERPSAHWGLGRDRDGRRCGRHGVPVKVGTWVMSRLAGVGARVRAAGRPDLRAVRGGARGDRPAHPLKPAGQDAGAIAGSAEESAAAFRTFRGAGFTQLEIMMSPGTIAALEALAPVLELLDAD